MKHQNTASLPMFLLSGQKGRDAMKTDRKIGGSCSVPSYRHPLVGSMNRCLGCLESIHDPHAKCWTPWAAGMTAVLMALDTARALFERFADARIALGMERTSRRMGATYNGLLKALVRQADTVLPRLKDDLRRQACADLVKIPRTCGWILLAVDGSKEELPRTADHERAFGMADNGQYPQALVTVIVEVSTGLLWDWRIDRSDGSEKHHLRAMVSKLPPDLPTLLLADGYYIGFDLWAGLQHAQQAFLIRVGGNVSLLTALFPDADIERQGDIVYAWPQTKQGKCPPLRLRLIRLGTPGHILWLLTNVLDAKRLSKKSAGTIYRLRWGAELFYRTFKRTLAFFKLHCRSATRGKVELEWALMACWTMTLMGIDALRSHRRDPRRMSPAGLVYTMRYALLHTKSAGPASLKRFQNQLALAHRDNYCRHRPKQSRHRPKTTNTPTAQLQPPTVHKATAKQRQLAKPFADKLAA
jgi:hypothetical protein